MKKNTILIADDEQDIVQMIRYNLRKEGFEVLEAFNGKQALEVAQQESPSAIVLDIMMPEMDGLEVCRRLRGNPATATIPVLFLTAKASEIDEVVGLEIGGDDYIQKPISPRILLTRIKAQLRRSTMLQLQEEKVKVSESLKIDGIEINRQNYTVRVEGVETFFPKKEFELLVFLCINRGTVFDRETLLRRIWGESVYVIDRTVDVHVSKVRDKLGKYSTYIETVKGIGYRFRP